MNSRVAVRRRVGARLRNLSIAVDKHVVPLHSEARVVGIEVGHDGAPHVAEVRVLNENLRTLTRVDARGWDVLVAAGVDVTGAEAQRRSPRIDIVPVVVVVGDTEVAAVLAAVAA